MRSASSTCAGIDLAVKAPLGSNVATCRMGKRPGTTWVYVLFVWRPLELARYARDDDVFGAR